MHLKRQRQGDWMPFGSENPADLPRENLEVNETFSSFRYVSEKRVSFCTMVPDVRGFSPAYHFLQISGHRPAICKTAVMIVW
jgi:hypothetical protein